VLNINQRKLSMRERFGGLLPVVIDIETSGLLASKHALLELAAVFLGQDAQGHFYQKELYAEHIDAFEGAEFDPEAMAITGIDPTYPLRFAIPEKELLQGLFAKITTHLKETGCRKAVLVGHNAWFDLGFIRAAAEREKITVMPLHAFTTIDTASLAAVTLGETVLARAVKAAGIKFEVEKAHSAIYDVEKTAELFFHMLKKISG
jgi:ribonuclease T